MRISALIESLRYIQRQEGDIEIDVSVAGELVRILDVETGYVVHRGQHMAIVRIRDAWISETLRNSEVDR